MYFLLLFLQKLTSTLIINFMTKKISILFLCLLAFAITSAQNLILEENWWIPNNYVKTIARDTTNNVVYIGGDFTSIGPVQQFGTKIDLGSGVPDYNAPMPNLFVSVSIPDGTGGWYIGGSFTMFGDSMRNNLAQINSSGQVTPWNPNPDGLVMTLNLAGNTLYVGGDFNNIGGQARNKLAALNATNGALTAWDPSPDYRVSEIVVSGTTVYCAGSFNTIGGQSRAYLAAVSSTTGLATSWNPNPNNSCTIASNGATLFVGGWFTTIGGGSRERLASFNISNGALNSWNPQVSGGFVSTLKVKGDTLYVGGNFSLVGGSYTRNGLASYNAVFGNLLAWNPNLNTGASVHTIAVTGNTAYVGGTFESVGGQTRQNLAAVDLIAGTPTSWTAHTDNTVTTISVSGSSFYVGGSYISLGGVLRRYLAALDGNTGQPTAWDPNPNDVIATLEMGPSSLYVGGSFTNIGGLLRSYLAELDTSTAIPTAWNPRPNALVTSIVVDDSLVWVGGDFTSFFATSGYHQRVAALRVSNGSVVLSWFGTCNGLVRTMKKSGGILYVGGDFTSFYNQTRRRAASIDLASQTVTNWNPNVVGIVTCLDVYDNRCILGGNFGTVGGFPRIDVASVDKTSGVVDAWNPNPSNDYVHSLGLHEENLLIGGSFSTIGGQTRQGLASIDTALGLATSWISPLSGFSGPYGVPFAMLSQDDKLYLGGDWDFVESKGRRHFAVFKSCNTIAPTGIATQVFCNPATVADLIAIGSSIQWYDAQIGGNFLVGTTILADGMTYYASQSISGCESQGRFAVIVSFSAPTPTGAPSLVICNSGTVADLIASGTNLQWYSTPSGGSSLSGTTQLVNGNSYYATQTISGCESPQRLAVAVTINASPAAPTGNSSQFFCAGAAVANLVASGTSIQWYDAPSGGNLLSNGDALVNGMSYYASQIVSGCASTSRLMVFVTINTPVAPSGSTSQTFCSGATVADLAASGSSILWYDAATGGNLVGSATLLINGISYYASQTTSGCESTQRLAVTVTVNTINAPTGNISQTFCGNEVVANLLANGVNIKWYDAPTLGNLLPGNTPINTSGTYYASQTIAGCESVNRLTVSVTIIPFPNAPTGSSLQTFCYAATVADLVATGTGLQWYNVSSGGGPLAPTTPLVNGIVYGSTQTIAGCEGLNRLTVTVTINTTAAPTGSASQTFCPSATVNDLIANGSSIQWYSSASGGSPLPSSAILTNGTTYYASQNVSNCESATRLAVTVTISTVNVTTVNNSPVLTASANGANYQWIDCNNGNAIIPGANNQSYTATATGSYAVIVTQNGCSDTSVCTNVTVVGIENGQQARISIYPNPVFDDLVNLDLGGSYVQVQIDIRNALGQLIASYQFPELQSTILDIRGESGLYFVEIRAESSLLDIMKVVKQR